MFGTNYDDERKTHPKLKPYHLLDEEVRKFVQFYLNPIEIHSEHQNFTAVFKVTHSLDIEGKGIKIK